MNMLFAPTECDARELEILNRIDGLRRDLRFQVAEPRRWTGLLRRVAMARAVQASNTIEGYMVSLDDALAAAAEEEPLEASGETWAAVQGYRNAMSYVLRLARDPNFRYEANLVRSLHFMLLQHEFGKDPGCYRPGAIYVTAETTGEIVYEGPDAAVVPALVDELLAGLANDGGQTHPIVRAAMAHLNLVMIHPFRDGNGRLARVLQSLVLAREEILAPEFASIEEYLGEHTRDYYAVLAEVGGGSWQPERDTRRWIRLCLTAHLRQAARLLRRLAEAESLWLRIEELAAQKRLPARGRGARLRQPRPPAPSGHLPNAGRGGHYGGDRHARPRSPRRGRAAGADRREAGPALPGD